MIKMFISQPMHGMSPDEIAKKRKDVIKLFCGLDVEFISSNIEEPEWPPLKCLGELIKRMSDADIVYFCKGWEHAKGCVVEHYCATNYGKQIMYE